MISSTNICEACFGKKLDKRERFSNWNAINLRKDQIVCIDALVFLDLIEFFKKLIQSNQINALGYTEFRKSCVIVIK